MKSEEGNETFKNGGYHSRKLGFKWRLYIFSSIYRNICLNNYPINFFSEIISIILTSFPLSQPICHYFQNLGDDYDNDNGLKPEQNLAKFKYSIWNTSYILSYISPDAISTNTILIGEIILMAFSLIFFMVCVMYPVLISKFHYLLSFPIHIILFQFFSSCFGFCIYYIARCLSDNLITSIASFFFIIFFFFYYCFFTFLSYIESNSLIRPNNNLFEWFHGGSAFTPFLILLYNVVGYNTERISLLPSRILLYSIQLVISFAVSLTILFKHPYHQYWMNDISSSKHLTVSFYSAVAICMNYLKRRLGTWLLSSIPVICLLIFMIIHFFNEFRRRSALRILNQIDCVENLSIEAIKLGLSSLTNVGQIEMVIKYGFSSGNKVVISPSFIRYCVEEYPESNWLISYIIFLYGTVWGADPISYRFFLHMLSVEKLHMVPELLLFQLIYCYMQCSETISPIIARYLEEYRWSFLIIAQSHKDFWLHASTTTSLRHFSIFAENYAFNFVKNVNNLKNLEAMFPFSPSVMYEKSMFMADFKNDYLISSKCFSKGSKMSSDGSKYIAFKLLSGYESMIRESNAYIDEKEPTEYTFLSLKESHDRAQRKASFFNTNDFYIKRLSNSFSTKPESLPQPVTFFRAETFSMVFTMVLMTIVAIILFFLHFHIQTLLQTEKEHYDYIKRMIRETIFFRQGLAICQYDIMLILMVESRVYENISKKYLREGGETPSSILNDQFFWFVINHLSRTEEDTSKYSIFFQDFSTKIGLPKLYAFNITYENSTFQSLFFNYHRTAIMFIQCRKIPAQVFEIDEFIYTIAALDDIAKQVYQHLSDHIHDYAKGSINRNAAFLIGLPIVDIVLAIAFGLALKIIFMNYLWKIFSIVRTIQPPALKTISVQFDRLLKFQEHHIPKVKTNPFYHPILYYILCLLSFFILPIVYCVKANNEKKIDDKNIISHLPSLPPIDSSINFMYYTFAVIEYLIKINSTLIPYYNASIVQAVFGPDPICVHYLFTSLVEVDEFQYNFYEEMKKADIILVTSLTLFFACLFFVLFIWSSWKYILLMNCINKIFHFINFRSAQTNPVLSQLYNGQSVSNDRVKKFSNDLQTPPTKFDFFLTFFFDENYDIVSHVGYLEKILNSNFYIHDLNSLVNFLNNSATIHKGITIDEFFSKKIPTKQLFFSLDEGSEFSMQFNNPLELFIKDESTNFFINKRRRMLQELSVNSDKLASLASLDTKTVVLLIIDQISIENISIILSKAKLYENQGLVKLDSRNNRLVFFISTFLMPNKTGKEATDIMFHFINDFSFILPQVKCAVDFGGPLQLFNTVKSPMAKSRAIGVIFDVLSLFTSSIKIGKFFITKSIADVIGLDNFIEDNDNEYEKENNDNLSESQNTLEFNQFKVTDKIIIQAAELPLNMIEKISNK